MLWLFIIEFRIVKMIWSWFWYDKKLKIEINESFGKVESLFNNIPSLETELNSDNNE